MSVQCPECGRSAGKGYEIGHKEGCSLATLRPPFSHCPRCGAGADPANTTRKDWWVAYVCGTGHNKDGTQLLEDENCLRRQLAQAREAAEAARRGNGLA